MSNELEICTLKVTFGFKGYSCSFTIRKEGVVIATAPTLPANRQFCLAALGYLALVKKIPEAERIGLQIQMETAFKEHDEIARPRIVPDLPTEVILDDVLDADEERTAETRH